MDTQRETLNATLEVLRKAKDGPATAILVERALRDPRLFAFGEILQLPNVVALNHVESTKPLYALLELFAFRDLDAIETLEVLDADALSKLRILTTVRFCSKRKTVDLCDLQSKLRCATQDETEDVIVSCVYADVLGGKVDHASLTFRVDWALGRDLTDTELDAVGRTFEDFKMRNEVAMQKLE